MIRELRFGSQHVVFEEPDLVTIELHGYVGDEYAELMAVALHNFAMMFAPEIVVFTGSFAEAAPLFLPATRGRLEKLLARRRTGTDLVPKLVVSKLSNQAGLIGGAYVALHA